MGYQALCCHIARLLFAIISIARVATPQKAACTTDSVLRALVNHKSAGSDTFCSDLLYVYQFSGYAGPDMFFPITTTVTRPHSKATSYVAITKTGMVTDTVTSYRSQQSRTAQSRLPTTPFPSYVHKYGKSMVSSGCKCLITTAPTQTIYTQCPDTSTETITVTLYTGKPVTTQTLTESETQTAYVTTTRAFPAKCPHASEVEFVAIDGTIWDRQCNTSFNSLRKLKHTSAPDFPSCIELCVAYNADVAYYECQGVSYDSQSNDCLLANSPTPFGAGGNDAIAAMRFKPKKDPSPPKGVCIGV